MDYENPGNEDRPFDATDHMAGPTPAGSSRSPVRLIPDANNQVVLPEGVTLDDVVVRGRDLVVELADGRTFVIVDGAVFVPVLVVEGVAIPPLNLAAYLNTSEPQPAAGSPQSSGGNFADPNGPIQAAYDLGDLLPYTELQFARAEEPEILPDLVDRNTSIISIPLPGDDGTRVFENLLPPTTETRTGESPGSDFVSGSSSTSGTITFTSPDGLGSVTIDGVAIVVGSLPQTIASDATGRLVVTSLAFDPATGAGSFVYNYILNDNTVDTNGSEIDFAVVVTDSDGDAASGTLTINIIDDAPEASPDVNSVTEGGSVSGNVLPNDLSGADGPVATQPTGGVIGVRAANGDTTTAITTGTGTTIQGQNGTLVLGANGAYTYVTSPNSTSQDVLDVFVYTIEDGDGDRSTTTLTLTIEDVTGTVTDNDVLVDESGLDGIGARSCRTASSSPAGRSALQGRRGRSTIS